jgi:hypothetical protein
MAAKKYLAMIAGRIAEVAGITSSAGAADDGKIPALDSSGRLDPTFMPVGIGADTATITASENLSGGDYVNTWDDGGTLKARKADATTSGKESDGFVLDAVSSGQPALVYFEGRNTALSGLTIGARYYLSAAIPGAPTVTPPSASGNVVQYLGRAISTTSMAFEATDGVILA